MEQVRSHLRQSVLQVAAEYLLFRGQLGLEQNLPLPETAAGSIMDAVGAASLSRLGAPATLRLLAAANIR